MTTTTACCDHISCSSQKSPLKWKLSWIQSATSTFLNLLLHSNIDYMKYMKLQHLWELLKQNFFHDATWKWYLKCISLLYKYFRMDLWYDIAAWTSDAKCLWIAHCSLTHSSAALKHVSKKQPQKTFLFTCRFSTTVEIFNKMYSMCTNLSL